MSQNLNLPQIGLKIKNPLKPPPSHLGHLEGEQPYLGDLQTMVFNHLPTGMILQVMGAKSDVIHHPDYSSPSFRLSKATGMPCTIRPADALKKSPLISVITQTTERKTTKWAQKPVLIGVITPFITTAHFVEISWVWGSPESTPPAPRRKSAVI